jgi:hypothetical protein
MSAFLELHRPWSRRWKATSTTSRHAGCVLSELMMVRVRSRIAHLSLAGHRLVTPPLPTIDSPRTSPDAVYRRLARDEFMDLAESG